MGFITDLLQELPLSAALRVRLEGLERDYSTLKTEGEIVKSENSCSASDGMT
jgi:hypothetical protein